MIATRGLKSPSFGVGERVMCFEPDPTKVRVLYDSKILKVDWTRDSNGKRVPEYLVHFNGWNHSWDRWAPENFILKYTDENLELQEKLQKEAEEKMRKKRRKRTWSEILEEAREKREKMAKENSASSADDSSVNSSDSDDSDDDEAVEVPITFPEALHAKLEDDCYFITSKKQLVRLPPDHTALSLMEAYVKDFAYRCQAHNVRVHVRQQGTAGMPVSLATANASNGDAVVPPPLPQYNVELCKEVMDGLRILFDFLLPTNLLYNCERAQYGSLYAQRPSKSSRIKDEAVKLKLCINGNMRTTRRSTQSPTKEASSSPPVLEHETQGPNESPPVLKPEAPPEGGKEEQGPAPARRVTRRSSTSNFNQSPPAPAHRELRSSDCHRRRSADIKMTSPIATSTTAATTTHSNKRDKPDTKDTPNNHLPPPSSRSLRHSSRLASHSSSSSTSSPPPVITNMESIPSLEAVSASSSSLTPAAQLTQFPSSSSTSTGGVVVSNGDDANASKEGMKKLRGGRGGSELVVDVGRIPQSGDFSIKTEDATGGGEDGVFSIERNSWKLLPESANYNGAEPPCRVYGAQHLLRLFVKLPEILGRMDLHPKKLKPLVKHIEMFLRWLSATDQLLEYFPDKAYINAVEALRDSGESKTRRPFAAK